MNRVAQLRKKRGLSQRALAKLAGTSQQQIARIEKGQEPKVELAAKVARALATYPEEVFDLPKVTEHDENAVSRSPFHRLTAAQRRKHDGEFVALDRNSGLFMFNHDVLKLRSQMHAARPDGRWLIGRVGAPGDAAYQLGMSSLSMRWAK